MEYIDGKLYNSIVHFVGNKLHDDGVIISKSCLEVNEKMADLLTTYFLSSFKSNEYFNFHHDSDLKYNEVFGYISEIFGDSRTLYEQSINLAKHLYEKSNHPKIKGGEFYVVYFKEGIVDGKTVDAIGLFKSENKDTFIKVSHSDDEFDINSEEGININKLDKGCLIFNTEAEDGYIVSIVDNTNKGNDAKYWFDEFLHVRQRKDEYYNTENVLSMCKTFVTKELPQHFDVTKADQADLLNKSVKFFKEKDSFDIEEFTNEVIEQSAVIDSFNRFRTDYQQKQDIEISDNFTISDSAVKRQSRLLKSVIKLDKNFHIYVHGDKKMIEQGEDSKGKFYKMYYNEES